LDRIRLKKVQFDNLALSNVIVFLDREARELDPAKEGLNFIINPNVNTPPGSVLTRATDLNSIRIKITPPLHDVSMTEVLTAIIKGADESIEFTVQDYAVEFAWNSRLAAIMDEDGNHVWSDDTRPRK